MKRFIIFIALCSSLCGQESAIEPHAPHTTQSWPLALATVIAGFSLTAFLLKKHTTKIKNDCHNTENKKFGDIKESVLSLQALSRSLDGQKQIEQDKMREEKQRFNKLVSDRTFFSEFAEECNGLLSKLVNSWCAFIREDHESDDHESLVLKNLSDHDLALFTTHPKGADIFQAMYKKAQVSPLYKNKLHKRLSSAENILNTYLSERVLIPETTHRFYPESYTPWNPHSRINMIDLGLTLGVNPVRMLALDVSDEVDEVYDFNRHDRMDAQYLLGARFIDNKWIKKIPSDRNIFNRGYFYSYVPFDSMSLYLANKESCSLFGNDNRSKNAFIDVLTKHTLPHLFPCGFSKKLADVSIMHD